MNWTKVIEKGVEGLGVAVISIIVANIPKITEIAVSLIPEEVAQLTVAGIVAFILKALGNWLKHIRD